MDETNRIAGKKVHTRCATALRRVVRIRAGKNVLGIFQLGKRGPERVGCEMHAPAKPQALTNNQIYRHSHLIFRGSVGDECNDVIHRRGITVVKQNLMSMHV